MIRVLFIKLFIVNLFLFAGSIVSYDTNLKLSQKGVTMLVFGTKTCPYCDILKKELEENGKLKTSLKDSTVYYISLDKNLEYKQYIKEKGIDTSNFGLKMQYGGKSTPTIIIFDNDWNNPVITLPGYIGKDTLAEFVNYVSSKAYKTKDLQKFINEKKL